VMVWADACACSLWAYPAAPLPRAFPPGFSPPPKKTSHPQQITSRPQQRTSRPPAPCRSGARSPPPRSGAPRCGRRWGSPGRRRPGPGAGGTCAGFGHLVFRGVVVGVEVGFASAWIRDARLSSSSLQSHFHPLTKAASHLSPCLAL